MSKEDLAERLKNLRFLRGYSVNKVAKMVKRAPNTIINWESGKVSPDIDTVVELCKIYKVKPNQMFGWEPCPELDDFIAQKQDIINQIKELQRQRADIDAKIKTLQTSLMRRSIIDADDVPDFEDKYIY